MGAFALALKTTLGGAHGFGNIWCGEMECIEVWRRGMFCIVIGKDSDMKCSEMECSEMCCSEMWCSEMWCNEMECSEMWCSEI